jgi:tight adherence protein C
MIAVASALAGLGVFLVATGRRGSLADRLGAYLGAAAHRPPGTADQDGIATSLARAGVSWSVAEHRARRAVAIGTGAAAGFFAAQGDLFITGPARSMPALTILGAAAGGLLYSMWLTGRRERRRDTLRQELPVVADVLALGVIAGESVATAIGRFNASASGVAAEELRAVHDAYLAGTGLTEALRRATVAAAAPEAGRLYTLLGNAHDTGGRLAEALVDLATDLRAGLERELTTEGGKRALASYGPILALMVPVTLAFLMYPTLAGLRQLAGGP